VNFFLDCNRVHVYTMLGYAPGARWSGWMYAIRRVTDLRSYLVLNSEFVKLHLITLDVLVSPFEYQKSVYAWEYQTLLSYQPTVMSDWGSVICLLLRVTRIVPC